MTTLLFHWMKLGQPYLENEVNPCPHKMLHENSIFLCDLEEGHDSWCLTRMTMGGIVANVEFTTLEGWDAQIERTMQKQ